MMGDHYTEGHALGWRARAADVQARERARPDGSRRNRKERLRIKSPMNIEFDRSCLKSAGQVSSTPALNEAERARALYVTKNARTRNVLEGNVYQVVSPLRVRAAMVVMPPPRVSAVGDASYELVHLPSADGSVPAVVFSGGANPRACSFSSPASWAISTCPASARRRATSASTGGPPPPVAGPCSPGSPLSSPSGEDAPVAPWAPRDRRSAVHAKKARASSAATRETRTRRFRAACALVSWRARPRTRRGRHRGRHRGGRRRRLSRRAEARPGGGGRVCGGRAPPANARSARSGGAPRVAFVGFGFGAAVGWAAAARLGRRRGRRRRPCRARTSGRGRQRPCALTRRARYARWRSSRNRGCTVSPDALRGALREPRRIRARGGAEVRGVRCGRGAQAGYRARGGVRAHEGVRRVDAHVGVPVLGRVRRAVRRRAGEREARGDAVHGRAGPRHARRDAETALCTTRGKARETPGEEEPPVLLQSRAHVRHALDVRGSQGWRCPPSSGRVG